MYMELLQIRQVRNLESIQLLPAPRLNFLTGSNASGKTAILEAIFLLSRGKSFRTPRIHDVVRNGHENLQVSARMNDELQGQIHTGIEKGRGEMLIRYNGARIKTISEQSRGVPVVLATQDSHLLVTAGPKERRHWLDWAMFHVEQGYLENWQTYMKALRHRNVLLKKGLQNRDLYRAWEQAMIESGTYLAKVRNRFLEELTTGLSALTDNVFSGRIRLGLSSRWPENQEAFTGSWATDLKTGYTRYGSHNVDVTIRKDDKGVAAVFSRGQIKLLVCLLMIAQAQLQSLRTGRMPILLIDDYMAELDKEAGEYLLSLLRATRAQIFLTDTEKKQNKNNNMEKLFHVEHGVVTEISNY